MLRRRPAVQGLTARLLPGCLTSLVGPDGAGKTTLIRLMAGLMMPTSGAVRVLGLDTRQEAGRLPALMGYKSAAEIPDLKIVPALIIGLIMAAAAVYGFRVPFSGSFGLLFACLVLFILSIVGIGLMISSISSTQQQAILGTFAVAVPASLLSGFATPVKNMPLVLQYLAQAIPLTHYLIILQGSFLKALSPAEILHPRLAYGRHRPRYLAHSDLLRPQQVVVSRRRPSCQGGGG